MVTCSRVAVRGSQRPLTVTDQRDFRHIVELTFSDDDDLRRVAYHQAGVDDTMTDNQARIRPPEAISAACALPSISFHWLV